MTFFDKELFERIKAGDERAFEYVFKSYYPMLCSYAYDLLKDKEQAEEVIQELLIRIWENRATLVITTSLKSYLYKSVHNQCINNLKHEQVVSNRVHSYSKDFIMNTIPFSIPEEEIHTETYDYAELENDINEAIAQLPEQCSAVFKMSRFDLLTYEAIAKELNISVNTVKTQMRRALEKLRAVIFLKINTNQKAVKK